MRCRNGADKLPPNSRSVDDEGILLDNVLIAKDDQFLEQDLRDRLGAGRWPSRNIDQNIADLKAQMAACAKGASELRRAADQFGHATISAYMRHLQAYSEGAVRKLIGRFQVRYGPNRVGPYGLLQPIADLGKMLQKENMVPEGARVKLYMVAPLIAMTCAIGAFGLMPFGNVAVMSRIACST